jgi:peptidyl-prolyl cis-trans isomerase SurA
VCSSDLGKVRNVAAGNSSEPLDTEKGVIVLFVCSRNDSASNIDRDAIMHSIGTEKLELQARRLIRDLRRAAYMDVRIGKTP